jgi:hypothetical protein
MDRLCYRPISCRTKEISEFLASKSVALFNAMIAAEIYGQGGSMSLKWLLADRPAAYVQEYWLLIDRLVTYISRVPVANESTTRH